MTTAPEGDARRSPSMARSRRREPWGFFVFLWYGVLWLPRRIASGIAEDLRVLLRLQWRPATGRARWRRDRPRPDPAASAWQSRIHELKDRE